jgi:hypothetical protein
MLSAIPLASAQSTYRLQRPADNGFQNTALQSQPSSPSQFVVQAQEPPPPPRQVPPPMLELGRALIGSFAAGPPSQPVRQAVPKPLSGFLQDSRMNGATAVFSVPTANQLKRISSRDVVIIIDKSRSMSEADCPADNMPANLGRLFMRAPQGGTVTRWEWCQRQTMHVASQLARMPGSNLKLVLFDDRVTEFDNVSIDSLSDIFNRYKPSGGTNATRALKTAIQEYFEKQRDFGRARPLSIVVITDGAPASPRSLKDLIIDTTLKMNNPAEIAISFLQIGRDDQGNQLLPELDLGLVPEGARFDIVMSRSFNSVSRTGLMSALLDTAR